MPQVTLSPVGDSAIAVDFENRIAPEINRQVHALAADLKKRPIAGICAMIPSFRSLLIQYNPTVLSYDALSSRLLSRAASCTASTETHMRIWQIPCCYGSHFGPDLPDLEQATGLDRAEIIRIHSSVTYKIYMLGFLPGFVYLGGLDPRIEMPRLASPRIKIPKGSVGIGGSQTGVYPVDSPGGWRLIGSTPVDFYDPGRNPPVLCQAGDAIRFCPISSCEYYDIRQDIRKGSYRPEVLTAKVSCTEDQKGDICQ